MVSFLNRLENIAELTLGTLSGILTLQPTSQPQTKRAGLARHQTAIFLIGLPCILLGSFAVVYTKELKGKEHATTWHAVHTALSLLSQEC